MLLELVVENYAVVDRLRVRFHPGLNLLTGETGSGKSIVVDALGLLLGARASAEMIRSGAERARVSGMFETGERAWQALEAAGFKQEDGELLLEREILANGKSRVYVNNRPATVALLKELAPHLGDIHGQHDQQLLFETSAQLSMLDSFAQLRDQKLRLRSIYTVWRKTSTEIADVEGAEQETLRMLDLWQFQRREIDEAELKPGEDEELVGERRVQQNSGKLLETAGSAYESLYESPEAAWPLMRSVARKLDELAKIDPQMASVRASLEPALIAIQEVSYSLRDYLNSVEANPERLEEIELRLETLDKLKRKYGHSVEEILLFREEVNSNIEAVESAGERLAALKKTQKNLSTEFESNAAELSAARRRAAEQLALRVEQELRPLAMERTVFRVVIEPAPWSETGADRVEFLVSPNPGEAPKPMEKIASGGEISRIALALKTCLMGSAQKGPSRTLVFDEIDTGIGGRAAEGVARRLKKLSAESQVLCVTHLAQIACFADHHYSVSKQEEGGRTVARIAELTGASSAEEIGRMLSGQTLTPEAVRNAEELIRAAHK